MITMLTFSILSSKAGGTNVDNWDFEGLMNVVTEFQQHYQIGGSQTPANASEAPAVADGMADSVGDDSAAAASATVADNNTPVKSDP